MIRKWICTGIIALSAIAAGNGFAAAAPSPFDGQWSLTFYTKRGTCEPSYNFAVNIRNGILRHPSLARFRGRVDRSGQISATLSVKSQSASGAGRLTKSSGRGNWSGSSDGARCSGTWVAARS